MVTEVVNTYQHVAVSIIVYNGLVHNLLSHTDTSAGITPKVIIVIVKFEGISDITSTKGKHGKD